MKTAATCQSIQDQLRDFLEGEVSAEARGELAAHLRRCPACAEALRRREKLLGLMASSFGAVQVGAGFEDRAAQRLQQLDQEINRMRTPGQGQEALPPEAIRIQDIPLPWEGEDGAEFADEAFAGPNRTWFERLGGAPWWLISGAFHALLLMLVALIGMAILRAPAKDTVIVANLEKKPEKQEEKEPEKPRDVFKHIKALETPEMVTETNIVTHEEVEIAEHIETDDNMEATEAQGEQGVSDIPLGATGVSASIGVGGGGAGAYGRPNSLGGRLRRAKAGGGGKDTESAVDKGLEWLARNQEADGSWNHAKHGGKHAGDVGDVAMTGYAVLAFLGAGHTEKVGKYKENVRKGVEYLISKQNQAGHEGRWVSLNYTNGIACMAISEAAAMGRIPATKEAAQKAVDGVDDAQIRRGGDSEREAWDYRPKAGTNDSSIMAWNILALKSAKVAGLTVDPATFEGALRWIDAGQDLGNAVPGQDATSDYEGGRMAYRGTVANPNKGKGSMAVMAAAALCRLHIGGQGLDHPGVAGPCNIMLKQGLPKKWPYNMYYGYYATLVMFQKGGEHWQAWNEGMKGALIPAQRVGGPEDGSWDPAPGCDGGRVMSTALCVMSLEVYYRYLPMFRDK